MDPVNRKLPISPLEGVWALFVGARLLLGEPRVRKPAWWGILVNAVAFLILVDGTLFLAFWLTKDLVDSAWYIAAFAWLVRLSAIAAVAIMAPILYGVVAALVLPMLKAKVFEQARRVAGGPEVPGGMGVLRSITVELHRVGRFLGFSALLMPLNLVAGWGTLAFTLAELALASHTLGWDLLAYHFELHDLPYRQQRATLKANRPLVFTVGLAGTLMNLIPIANALFITSHVAGAGVISARIDRRQAHDSVTLSSRIPRSSTDLGPR